MNDIPDYSADFTALNIQKTVEYLSSDSIIGKAPAKKPCIAFIGGLPGAGKS
ncbi:hypothetical protein [Treponema sp. R6D11]